ncbi:hypothetical protein CYLTODRAFT_330948, partial [Cylindrobasidium torrendii FP15055 ss-10]
KADWAKWLKLLEFAYNSHVSATTGESPFTLLLGFQPPSPMDIKYPQNRVEEDRYGLNEKGRMFVKGLTAHRDSARRAIAKAQEQQKRAYDKGRKDNEDIEEGSFVLI